MDYFVCFVVQKGHRSESELWGTSYSVYAVQRSKEGEEINCKIRAEPFSLGMRFIASLHRFDSANILIQLELVAIIQYCKKVFHFQEAA